MLDRSPCFSVAELRCLLYQKKGSFIYCWFLAVGAHVLLVSDESHFALLRFKTYISNINFVLLD